MSAITPDLVAAHQLTDAEYEKIVSLLGREPTYTELGIFSVMWSEHCSYKSSRVHLKKLPTESQLVLQGPGENAGIIDIGDGCGDRVQDRIAQPPQLHRAVPGRGDRRRRHPARHLHDGRAADRGDGLAALRPARRSARNRNASSKGVVARHRALRQLLRRADRGRRDASSSRATTAIRW